VAHGVRGRISHLKHGYGFERTVLDGIGGATTWCGWGLLAHNSVKIGALVQKKNDKSAEDRQHRPRGVPSGTGPPTGRSPTSPPVGLTDPRSAGFTRRARRHHRRWRRRS